MRTARRRVALLGALALLGAGGLLLVLRPALRPTGEDPRSGGAGGAGAPRSALDPSGEGPPQRPFASAAPEAGGAGDVALEERRSPLSGDEAGDEADLPRTPLLAFPQSEIVGRVVDPDGWGLAGASVRWHLGCTGAEIITDADGAFVLGAPPALHHLRVLPPQERDDLLPLVSHEVRVPRDRASTDAGELRLGRAAPLTVVIPEGIGGTLHVALVAGGFSTSRPLWFASPESGFASPEPGFASPESARQTLGVPAGELQLTLWDPEGWWAQQRVRVPAEGATVELEPRDAPRIRGRVVDAGRSPVRAIVFVSALGLQPSDSWLTLPRAFDGKWSGSEDPTLSAAQVTLLRRSPAGALSGADGRFASAPLPPGRYRVSAAPLDLERGRGEVAVELTVGRDEQVTLRTPPARSVLLRANVDLSRARVSAFGPVGSTLARSVTGEVRLHGLLPDDRALVLVEVGGVFEEASLRMALAQTAGGAEELHLTVAPPAALEAITQDAAGRPGGAGVLVWIEADGAAGAPWMTRVGDSLFDDPPHALVGSRRMRDNSDRGDALAWTEEMPEHGGVHLELAPGAWHVGLVGQPGQAVTLDPLERREVRLTVR